LRRCRFIFLFLIALLSFPSRFESIQRGAGFPPPLRLEPLLGHLSSSLSAEETSLRSSIRRLPLSQGIKYAPFLLLDESRLAVFPLFPLPGGFCGWIACRLPSKAPGNVAFSPFFFNFKRPALVLKLFFVFLLKLEQIRRSISRTPHTTTSGRFEFTGVEPFFPPTVVVLPFLLAEACEKGEFAIFLVFFQIPLSRRNCFPNFVLFSHASCSSRYRRLIF